MSTKLDRLTELAKEEPKRQFFSIAHLITPEALYAAFGSLRKDASAGMDGVTYKEYQQDAERNVQALYQRLRERRFDGGSLPSSSVHSSLPSRSTSTHAVFVPPPSTPRIFSTAPTGSDPDEGSTRHWRKWVE